MSNFRNVVFQDGMSLSVVRRNKFRKDEIYDRGVFKENVPELSGVDLEIVESPLFYYYFSPKNGRVQGSPELEITLPGEEELRDNILCRILDYVLIKMVGALESDNPNKGSCV